MAESTDSTQRSEQPARGLNSVIQLKEVSNQHEDSGILTACDYNKDEEPAPRDGCQCHNLHVHSIVHGGFKVFSQCIKRAQPERNSNTCME